MNDWFIHGAVVLALIVVIPLAFTLDERLQGRSRIPRSAVVGVGALAGASFLISEGAVAAAMCIPWVALCVGAGLERVAPFATFFRRLVLLLPHGYLAFGAAWLVVSRYGGRPLDFPDVIVELTAVHFHYAGFVAPLLIALGRSRQARGRGVLLVALGLALVATPLTAIGFVYSAAIGAAGAVLFAGALFIWSVVTMAFAVPRLAGLSRALLAVAAVSVLVTMTMAVGYSVGVAVGESWIDIPTMARTHGVLNALGFALCGTVAWLLTDVHDQSPELPSQGVVTLM